MQLTQITPTGYCSDADLLKLLVGKTVKEVRLHADKTLLAFICDSGDYLYCYTDGDCCSSSWIEHLNGLKSLLGHVVNNVVTRDMPEVAGESEWSCISCYGWTLETNAGRCDIEMRNESNGYYGGNLMNSSGDPLELPLVTEDF